ncbi:MAG: hypothetical protein ACRYGP_03550 [Janthinobacterium lividum]
MATSKVAAHFAKDLPTALLNEIAIPGSLPREDVRGAFISRYGSTLADLPPRANVRMTGYSVSGRSNALRALVTAAATLACSPLNIRSACVPSVAMVLPITMISSFKAPHAVLRSSHLEWNEVEASSVTRSRLRLPLQSDRRRSEQ